MGNVSCAFCKGAGKDPFSLLSPMATCQVCGGNGKAFVLDPVTKCHFCAGTGVQPRSRLTCTVCKGAGSIHVKNGKVCLECKGSGKHPSDSDLPCSTCSGRGVA